MPIVISTNMNLPVPIVGQEAGPQYATDINSCMSIIDSHTHTPGSGVFITTNALNINADLPFNGNRYTGVKSAVFNAQSAPLAAVAPDLGAVYVAGVDLYYNDENGNIIRITQSGGVVGSPGSITGLVPPASVSYVAADSTFVFQSDANTSANLDASSVIFRNLTANSFGVTVSAPAALGTDYSLVLPLLPTPDPRVLTIDTSGNITPSQVPGTGTTQADVLPGFGLTPSGAILAFGGTSAPVGYLLCNGASVLRATYPALFTAIGTAYGTADGTHFNVPDLRGYFVRGTDNGAGRDPDASSRTALYTGGNTGDNVGSSETEDFHSHTHTQQVRTENTNIFNILGLTLGTVTVPPNANNTPSPTIVNAQCSTLSTGGNETRPKNIYANYIIKT